MKKTLLLLIFFAAPTLAYNPTTIDPSEPYEPVEVFNGEPSVAREYLGQLDDFPEMMELSSAEPFTLTVEIRQRDQGEPYEFALIAVRVNEDGTGVTEIARLKQPIEEWRQVSDSVMGMKFLVSEPLQVPVEAGTYRVEISTPDNGGEYMLVFGEMPTKAGYFAMLGNIFETQQNFKLSWLHIFASSYVYYPVGIIIVLAGLYITWRRRKQIAHVA
ncbi:MAG: hypothetical protein AAB388_00880 [Patescibacteria group bacterium]